MVEAVAWMPWAVLAAHRLVEHRRAMDAVWLGAVWAIQFLADPRTSFYTVVLTVMYLVAAVVFATRIQSPEERAALVLVFVSWCLGGKRVVCDVERGAVAAAGRIHHDRAIAAR